MYADIVVGLAAGFNAPLDEAPSMLVTHLSIARLGNPGRQRLTAAYRTPLDLTAIGRDYHAPPVVTRNSVLVATIAVTADDQ